MMMTKLKIYKGLTHPHQNQNPKLVDFTKLNKKNIDIVGREHPVIKQFLSNTSQFTKTSSTTDRYYADGKIIDAKLPPAYGLPQVKGQKCHNCKFRHNNYCSYWRAQIRNKFWCKSWNPQKTYE